MLVLRWLLGLGLKRVVYGDGSVMSAYMAATSEASVARANAVADWKANHKKNLGTLATYSLGKMSTSEKGLPIAADLLSMEKYLRSRGAIADVNTTRVALGSYAIRGKVLGADKSGMNVRFTVEETQSIHSAAHIVTGYGTGAERVAKGLGRSSGPMANVTHVITWKEVILFDQG